MTKTTCNNCTSRKTCWVRWDLINLINKINEHPSEIFSISGATRKANDFRETAFQSLAYNCLHYQSIKSKFV